MLLKLIQMVIGFALPTEIIKKIWPTEDYQLAISRVAVETPETDLFQGLR